MIKDVKLSNFTTVCTGGLAKEFITVKSENHLLDILKSVQNKKYIILGGGSNLIFPDSGYNGVVIKNEISGIEIKNGNILVKSGTILMDLVNFTIDNGLEGMQKMIGIPGTVGGAIYGNAGAYGQAISDNLLSVKVVRDGKIHNITKNKCKFDYRDSIFKQTGDFILETIFKLKKGSSEIIKEEADQVYKIRIQRYPPGIKCPGSFFKNVNVLDVPKNTISLIPKDKIRDSKVFVGWLLETIDSKGFKVGGVGVSDYHCNLFINNENGRSQDYYNLASSLAKKVKEKFDINIEPEVQLIDMPPLI